MIASDPLHHHGGVKALTGHVLLQAMGQLEQRTADIQTPYLLIWARRTRSATWRRPR